MRFFFTAFSNSSRRRLIFTPTCHGLYIDFRGGEFTPIRTCYRSIPLLVSIRRRLLGAFATSCFLALQITDCPANVRPNVEVRPEENEIRQRAYEETPIEWNFILPLAYQLVHSNSRFESIHFPKTNRSFHLTVAFSSEYAICVSQSVNVIIFECQRTSVQFSQHCWIESKPNLFSDSDCCIKSWQIKVRNLKLFDCTRPATVQWPPYSPPNHRRQFWMDGKMRPQNMT